MTANQWREWKHAHQATVRIGATKTEFIVSVRSYRYGYQCVAASPELNAALGKATATIDARVVQQQAVETSCALN